MSWLVCHHKTGRTVTLHPDEITILTQWGLLEQGWQLIEEMNNETIEGVDDREPA